MKLLVDQNLPKRLVRLLGPHFPGTAHVRELEMDQKYDTDLWTWAKKNGFSILSKDKDFEHWSTVRGAPPKVIWLRVGNCPAEDVVKVIEREMTAIRHFMGHPHRALLILEP